MTSLRSATGQTVVTPDREPWGFFPGDLSPEDIEKAAELADADRKSGYDAHLATEAERLADEHAFDLAQQLAWFTGRPWVVDGRQITPGGTDTPEEAPTAKLSPVEQLTACLDRLDRSRTWTRPAVYRLLKKNVVPGVTKRDDSLSKSWHEIPNPEWSARSYLRGLRKAA